MLCLVPMAPLIPGLMVELVEENFDPVFA